MICKPPLLQLAADKPPALELVSQLQTAATANPAWHWVPLHALTAEGRGSPSGPEMSAVTCRNSEATITGSPVTPKWCDLTAVLLISPFKSAIQIRSAPQAFIRLTKLSEALAFLYQIPAAIHNHEVLNMTRYFKGPSKAQGELRRQRLHSPSLKASNGSHNYFSQG